jgi:hypothetical protein
VALNATQLSSSPLGDDKFTMEEILIPIALHRTRSIMLCLQLLCVFLAQNLGALQTLKGIVGGKVVDDSTNSPLPFTNIFIANSTLGTFADSTGRFQLGDVPYGIHKVVASIVGYIPQIVTVRITDTTAKSIVFRLKLRNLQLSPVDIEGNEPKEWKRNLQKFLAEFFGSTSNAKECKLLNPEVLDFVVDEKTSEFVATVREPLVIENNALGYRLYYYLKYFKLTKRTLQFFGEARFDQLGTASEEESSRWKVNREDTYYGSRRHFFSTLFHNTSKENGFTVKSISKKENQQPDFYRFETGSYINLPASHRTEETVNAEDFVGDGASIYEKKLSFPGSIQVTFYKGLFNSQTSQVELEQSSITIYSDGEIAEPLGVLTSGYWSTQRAAELLPSDYEP